MAKEKIDLQLIEELSQASGVSGAESAVRGIVQDALEPYVDLMQVDAMGNLLVRSRMQGPQSRPRIMVAAHLDEVGFMLTSAEGDGCFRFDKVGGIAERYVMGKAVLVGKERIPGLIGLPPVHFSKGKDKRKVISLEKLRIDVGPAQEGAVKVGDRAVYSTPCLQVGNHLMGKAFDDRLGVAILLTLIKNPPSGIDLLAAFTVQEEIGLRGGRTAAHALDPDGAIVLDATPARDFPTWESEHDNAAYNARLGKGAAVYTADSGTISDPRLLQHFIQTAQSQDIPYQLRQPGGGRTDAAMIHRQRAGVPSLSISVPVRFLHTPVSLANLEDIQATLALLRAGLEKFPSDLLRRGER